METLTFRHALQDDMEQIMELVGAAIEKMKASGIDQWDEIYPAAEDFLDDMASGGMYWKRIPGEYRKKPSADFSRRRPSRMKKYSRWCSA